MSVEFDATHQGGCCCQPLILEQHCSAVALASPSALMQPVPYPFLCATLKVGKEVGKGTLL